MAARLLTGLGTFSILLMMQFAIIQCFWQGSVENLLYNTCQIMSCTAEVIWEDTSEVPKLHATNIVVALVSLNCPAASDAVTFLFQLMLSMD